jgi:DNA-binding GntR family transcriptional regulator
MDSSRTLSPAGSVAPPSEEAKPGFRTKTIATRITPEELAEVEAAAERDGKSLAEWLRELVLNSARQRPTDPVELLLSEVAATRYMLLNLFHATAQANAEGKHLLPDSVLKIRDQAAARKLESARKLMADFLAQGGQDGNRNGGKS